MVNLLSNVPLSREEGFSVIRSFGRSIEIAKAIVEKKSIEEIISEGQYCFSKSKDDLILVAVAKENWKFYRSDMIEGGPVCEKTIADMDRMILFMLKNKKLISKADLPLLSCEDEVKEKLEPFASDEEIRKYDRYFLDDDLRHFLIAQKKDFRMNLYHLVQTGGEVLYEALRRYFKKEIHGRIHTGSDGIKPHVSKDRVKFGAREISVKDLSNLAIELVRGGEMLSELEVLEYQEIISEGSSEEKGQIPEGLGYADYRDKLDAEEKIAKKSKDRYFLCMWYSGVKFLSAVCESSTGFSDIYTEGDKTLVGCMEEICEKLSSDRAGSFSDIALYGSILRYFLPEQKAELNLSITMPEQSIIVDAACDPRELETAAVQNRKKLLSIDDLMNEPVKTGSSVKKTENEQKTGSEKERTAQVDLFSLIS